MLGDCRQVGFLTNKSCLCFIISLGTYKGHNERICYETTAWNFSLDLVFFVSCSLRTHLPQTSHSLCHDFPLFLLYLSKIIIWLYFWVSKNFTLSQLDQHPPAGWGISGKHQTLLEVKRNTIVVVMFEKNNVLWFIGSLPTQKTPPLGFLSFGKNFLFWENFLFGEAIVILGCSDKRH